MAKLWVVLCDCCLSFDMLWDILESFYQLILNGIISTFLKKKTNEILHPYENWVVLACYMVGSVIKKCMNIWLISNTNGEIFFPSHGQKYQTYLIFQKRLHKRYDFGELSAELTGTSNFLALVRRAKWRHSTLKWRHSRRWSDVEERKKGWKCKLDKRYFHDVQITLTLQN